MKQCSRCRLAKPASAFAKDRSKKSGLTSQCRKCQNARIRQREHLKRTAVSDITPEYELELRRKARACPMCSVRLSTRNGLPNSKHLDHIVPLCIGGTHTIGNVRITCASCNLRRPKDGSDYEGPVTLWAQVDGVVTRPDSRRNTEMCGKSLHPWVPENIGMRPASGKFFCKACRALLRPPKPLIACIACKAPFQAASDRQKMCEACAEAAGTRAAELHASGVGWAAIAPLVGYSTPEGARYAAKRIGYVPAKTGPVVRELPVRPCPDCGQPLGKYRSDCPHCAEQRAWEAVAMRRSGHTLRQIADHYGYASINSVTNLLKTVIEVEPKMGRPRKAA